MVTEVATARQVLTLEQELRSALAAANAADDALLLAERERRYAAEMLEDAEADLIQTEAFALLKNDPARKAHLRLNTLDERCRLNVWDDQCAERKRDLRNAERTLSTLRALVRLTASEE